MRGQDIVFHQPVKAKVAQAAFAGEKPSVQLTREFEVHQNQIVDWKKLLSERAAEGFGTPLRSLTRRW